MIFFICALLTIFNALKAQKRTLSTALNSVNDFVAKYLTGSNTIAKRSCFKINCLTLQLQIKILDT